MPVDPGIDVSDPDSLQLQSAQVSITTNFSSADGDTLSFTDPGGITGSYTASTGVLALTGTASVAAYHDALSSVTFGNTSNTPSTATRTLSFEVKDTDGATGSVATRDVTVATQNDAPVNSVPARSRSTRTARSP